MILRDLTPRPGAPDCPVRTDNRVWDDLSAAEQAAFQLWAATAYFAECSICQRTEEIIHACGGRWIKPGLCDECFARVPDADLSITEARMLAADLSFKEVFNRDFTGCWEDGDTSPVWDLVWAAVAGGKAWAESLIRRCFSHYDLDALFASFRADIADYLLESRYGGTYHPLLLRDRQGKAPGPWVIILHGPSNLYTYGADTSGPLRAIENLSTAFACFGPIDPTQLERITEVALDIYRKEAANVQEVEVA